MSVIATTRNLTTGRQRKGMAASRRQPAAGAAVVSGHLTGIDDEGRLLFRPEGADGAEQPAIPVAIGVELSDGVLVKAARQQRRALAVRTADAVPRWVMIGLVRERISSAACDARPGKLEVSIDGESLVLSAEHDLTLACGKSSLTLRYDGKVVISGTNLVSTSRGPNRIKGASVAIN